MKPEPLTKDGFYRALRILRECDADIDRILSVIGPPKWLKRRSGFPTLVRIILEQQVSLASARAVYARLQQSAPALNPREFLKLDADALRGLGLSRQKARCCRALAEAIIKGDVRLNQLEKLPDQEARKELTKIPGIGQWTADIYLMEALRRPDIWPVGDLALAVAVQKALNLEKRPTPARMEKLGKKWKPWRAAAARVFWYNYLNESF